MKSHKIFVLTIFLSTLISCGGAEERKSVYMEKAKTSIDAGNLDKARIELKNVLHIDPKDGTAHYYLGSVYEKKKDYSNAYRQYLKAEKLSPELLANHAKLGQFYLSLMNDTVKAQEKIDLILSKDPNNADGLLLKAAALLRGNKLNEAITIAKNIVDSDSNNTESIAFLSALYMKEKNFTDAIKVLDAGIKNNQDNERLSKLLATALINNKENERAEEIYKKFLERNPDNVASYNNLAVFYNLTENKVKAETILRAAIKNDPDDVDRIVTLVKYIRTSKSEDDAISELKGFIASNNSLGKLRTGLAELHFMTGDKQAAINVYKQAVIDFSKEETGVISRLALATIYTSEKEFDKANETIEEVTLISPNDPKVNMLRARLAVRDNDMEKAIISLRIVTKEEPENIDAYLLLAGVYQLEKNTEQVESVLNSAYSNNKGNAESLIKLAQYHSSRDIQQAEKIIDDYNNIKPSDYDGLSMKAAILSQNKKYEEANKIAETLMELYPERPSGYLLTASYYIEQRDKQNAISVLEKGYQDTKDNRKILTLLTTLQGSDKQFDVVENRIKAELNVTPDDDELKILLYKVYVAKNDTASAEPLLNEVVSSNTDLEEPYLWLAQSYSNKKDLVAAKSILIKGVANVTSSLKIPFALAALYESKENYSGAIDVYRESHRSNPGNQVIINNLASLLSDHGDSKSDLELAKTLADKLDNKQPVFLDTIGWVNYKLGDYQNAIAYLKQVVELVPAVNVFNYHLGMAYKMAGDKDQAKLYLEKSLADQKQFKEKELAEAALSDL